MSRSQSMRARLERQFAVMRVGQVIEVDRRELQEAYPPQSILGDGHTTESRFLATRIGSAWGCWTCEYNPISGSFRIGRHDGGDKRVYTEPDRIDLYDRMPDGELVLKA